MDRDIRVIQYLRECPLGLIIEILEEANQGFILVIAEASIASLFISVFAGFSQYISLDLGCRLLCIFILLKSFFSITIPMIGSLQTLME
ncbi:MAG: hypothetical protein M0Z77_05465 [Thermoplasmatales archaeon]|jgi:hypothetical protein|nr:hypothetical protein [Thermoplasmatales archaeon]